jgi:hypothetical protein
MLKNHKICFVLIIVCALGSCLFCINTLAQTPTETPKVQSTPAPSQTQSIPAPSSAQPPSDPQKANTGAQKAENGALNWCVKVIVPVIKILIWPLILIGVIWFFGEQIRIFFENIKLSEAELPGGIKVKFAAKDSQQVAELITQFKHISAVNAQDSQEQAKQAGRGVQILGDTNQWQLFCKFQTDDGMQKSTKVMNLPTGCLVQATTREIGPNGQVSAAESVTFVPDLHAKIENKKDEKGKIIEIIKAEFINISSKPYSIQRD